jgi:hypothetical protein
MLMDQDALQAYILKHVPEAFSKAAADIASGKSSGSGVIVNAPHRVRYNFGPNKRYADCTSVFVVIEKRPFLNNAVAQTIVDQMKLGKLTAKVNADTTYICTMPQSEWARVASMEEV